MCDVYLSRASVGKEGLYRHSFSFHAIRVGGMGGGLGKGKKKAQIADFLTWSSEEKRESDLHLLAGRRGGRGGRPGVRRRQ